MTLGLFVGIAALGVISTRAVVERRQQIGVLRAIGYQRRMVAASFLLESSFISMLGILIGVVLGLILSYNFVEFTRKDTPQIVFDVPWLQITGIIVLSYIASLITTILPARQASQVYPAEALRYE
jgi:putative ABC transport system permease protein